MNPSRLDIMNMESVTDPHLSLETLGCGGESVNSLQNGSPSSLPKDSMVTIRLTDSAIDSAIFGVTPELAIENLPGDEIPLLKYGQELLEDGVRVISLDKADSRKFSGELKEASQGIRESIVFPSIIEEEVDSTSVSQQFRSRSNSSCTLSSVASAHVDWDQLDKREEQAPRNEGSDEVCFHKDESRGSLCTKNP